MPNVISKDIDHDISGRVAVIANQDDERLRGDIDRLLSKGYRVPKPLQSSLSLSGINRLLLSPDGALNLLPFAPLIDEHGEYVAQRFELTYLTSGRDLLRLAAPAPARGSPW
ncbi:CHAT domain-containing protein [Bradyrhizobium sp. S3.12.5]